MIAYLNKTSPLNIYSIFLIVHFCFINLQNLYAQEDELKFEHLTIDDGLSQNKINCIYQDSRGYMWFGTNEGLNKYDGYEFTVFGKGNNNLEKLSDDWVQCIFEDSKGNLWIGTGTGGLNLYDRKTNHFTTFTSDSSSLIQMGNNNIRSIIEDHLGNLWVATAESIDMLDLQNKKSINYIPSHFGDVNSANSALNTIFEDSAKNLWFGTGGSGLGRINRKTHTFEYFRHDPNNKSTISDNDVLSIYEDKQGNLWIGTYNGGLSLFDPKRKEFRSFSPTPKVQESLSVQAIREDDQGNLWLGTRNGLYLFNTKKHTFFHSIHDPHNPYSLNQDNIWSLFRDKKGDFWIGTKGGINYLNTSNMSFVHFRADSYDNRHLNNKLINTIYEDSSGDMWFGTEGGLNQLHKKSGTYTYYTHNPADPHSIGSNTVTAITQDINGNLWIGTHQGGLNFFDRKTKQFTNYTLSPDISLNFTSVNALLLDTNNDIWIGAGQSGGLFKYNFKEKTFIQIPLGTPDLTPSARCIIQDKNGNIWVGTNINLFFKINPSTLTNESYQIPGGTAITIITNIREDKASNLWIGTQGNGLIYFNTKKRTFHRYTQKDGLVNNHAMAIVLDNEENLWIGTYNGLSKLYTRTRRFKNYYRRNGLQSNQFTPAVYKTQSGEIFFGGINGVTAFYPEKIVEAPSLPTVVFTDFKIFNKSVKIGSNNPILKKNIEDAQEIHLSYKHSVFTFTYATLDYSANDRIQYAYIMEGFESNWNYVGRRRFATYTNLNPGTYTFSVKAAKSSGEWNNQRTSIRIIVSPPFWETWWFRLIVAAIIFLVIWHFIDYHKQKRDLLKATALANLTQLKLLRNQMNPHFLLNAFSAIRALVLIDKNQAWNSVSELSDYFRYVLQNYNKVGAFLNDEIDAAKNYINIQSLLNESLSITFEIDDATRECIVPAFLFQPLIENATKYGSNDESGTLKIKIFLTYKEGALTIDVCNTGRFKQAGAKTVFVDKSHGNSIINIKKRLEIMFKDHFTFELSEEDGWVRVKIIIDYENSSFDRNLQTKTLTETANSLSA
jgi:ligand-binding sensor domain-containing protein